MKNIFIIVFFLTLVFGQNQIEGRWNPGGFNNTMYEFLDGLRYTYYCADENGCDIDYWNSLDTSDAIPNPNPYWVDGNTLTIDLFFGNEATYTMGFRCDGQVVDFYYDEDDWVEGLHSTMFRLGFDDFNNDCLDTNPDDCLCNEEWNPVCGIDGNTYPNACFATCEYIVIAYEGECLVLNEEIEGRWHLVGYEDNVMYQFVDDELYANGGLRYTLYSIDGNFGDLDEAGGSPNPYSIVDDIITINMFFGTIVSYKINFTCDGQVVEFRSIENENLLHSTLFREGYEYHNNQNCQCENGSLNNNNPCNPMECIDGQWLQIVIDCAEPMGIPCEGGLYIPPPEGVCCSECILFGDINYDSEINVLDVIQAVSLILNGQYNEIADMNFDAIINILDVIEIINIILD